MSMLYCLDVLFVMILYYYSSRPNDVLLSLDCFLSFFSLSCHCDCAFFLPNALHQIHPSYPNQSSAIMRCTFKTKNTKKGSSSIKPPMTTDAEDLVIPTNNNDVYSNECCTAGLGCTKNDNCCSYFGIPGSGACVWNEDSGCCWGTCTYPVGRVRCNPWVPAIPTNTCIPATGLLFTKNNNKTTKDGLKDPFQTCYKYGNDGTNVCYTQSWTDGSGYYYQCSPKDPYEAFTYKVPWCGEPCKDVAPATNTCNSKDESCWVDDDCCGDLECYVSYYSFSERFCL